MTPSSLAAPLRWNVSAGSCSAFFVNEMASVRPRIGVAPPTIELHALGELHGSAFLASVRLPVVVRVVEQDEPVFTEHEHVVVLP